MPISVLEVPSRKFLSREENQWTATRAFSVTGSASQIEALGATGIPRYDEPHPSFAGLLVKGLSVEETAPTLRTVTASYKRGGGGDSEIAIDEPPTFYWSRGSRVEEFNRDIYGNRIANTNGDGFEGNNSVDIGTLLLRVERNEPYFDIPKSLAYQNTVNSDTFTVFGYGSVEPGQCLCTSIIPTAAHRFDVPYVRMAYDFEFRAGDEQSGGLWDGFMFFALNQGYRAYATVSGATKPYKIADTTKTPISTPVNLKVNGTPFETGFKALDDAGAVQTIVATPLSLPSQVYTKTVGDAVYLKFQQYKKKAFAGLI